MENNKTKEILEKKTWYFYVCCFFVYCFIGWIYEVCWEFKVGNGFVNRGFLHGCYLPIYGFGVLILYFILGKLMKKKIKIWKINITPVLVFIAIFFIASAIEYFSSWVMEMLFHQRWWDYTYSDKLNLNGRVSVRNSLLLTTGAMVMLYGVQPLLDKFLRKVNDIYMKIIAILISITMSVDLIVVLAGYIIK